MTALLCSFLFLGIVGCSSKSESPKVVTGKFLDAYANKNETDIRTYSQWKEYSVKALHIQKSDYIDGVDKSLQKKVFEMMQSFQHKEEKETVQDDNATVVVTLTLYDFSPVVEAGLAQASAKAEELSKQSEISDAQAQAQINTILFQNMKNAKQTKKETITINLVKKDGEWLVSNDNADIQNILISNMQSLQSVAN